MEGCKSIEYSARCWLYNEYVDEPEIIEEEENEGLVSFNRCVPGTQRKKIFLEGPFYSILGIDCLLYGYLHFRILTWRREH